MKVFFFFLLSCLYIEAGAQELFVFTEPASNMPAHSLSTKLSSAFSMGKDQRGKRLTPEVMLGFNKKFMMHIGTSISNMHSSNTRWESVFLYGKYRFLSKDDVHRHFRMALFTDLSYSRNDYHFDEVSLQGDRSGVQLGLIATQLLNKLALSGTVSHIQAFDESRKAAELTGRTFQAMNYSFSAGYLVLPFEYKNFDQLNFNIYMEVLGQQTIDQKSHYLDLAPAIQFIFKSNTKLNVGYRFQVDGNQFRGMQKSLLISLEHTFFNALKRN